MCPAPVSGLGRSGFRRRFDFRPGGAYISICRLRSHVIPYTRGLPCEGIVRVNPFGVPGAGTTLAGLERRPPRLHAVCFAWRESSTYLPMRESMPRAAISLSQMS